MSFSVHVILACEDIQTVFTGGYLDAYWEWADLAETHPIPIDTVLLTHSRFNPQDLRLISDFTKNSDILEIG